MAGQEKIYLDDQGNEIKGTGTYLTDTGDLKPVSSHAQPTAGQLELARITGGGGTTGEDELRRITPIPGRAKYLPAAGAMTLGTLGGIATGGAGLIPALGMAALTGAGGAGYGAAMRDAMGESGPEGPSVTQNVEDMAKESAANVAGEGIGRGVTAAARKVAPKLMDWGLMRTLAQKRANPTTGEYLVEHGIIPTPKKVEGALDMTEDALMKRAQEFDAARPQVAGYLGPATELHPLGITPMPSHGEAAVTAADRSAGNLPPTVGSFHTTQPPYPVFSGEPTGEAIADVVEGPGAIRRPMQVPPPRGGAPRQMVDPEKMASEARDFAYEEGKVRSLGNKPGQDAADIEAARDRYLAQNDRPRTLTETIEQKRAYQQRANYSNNPNAKSSTDAHANFDKGIAAANRRAALQLDPALAPDLASEQALLGAREALERFHNTPVPLSSHGPVRHLLLRPGVVGSAAIGLDRTGRYVAPDAIRAALIAAMSPSH